MHPVIVPVFFSLQNTLRCRVEGATPVDGDVFVVGMLMVVIVASVVHVTNKTVGWCFCLPPLLLLLIGTFYQRFRSYPQ